jgi:hypothetical protein
MPKALRGAAGRGVAAALAGLALLLCAGAAAAWPAGPFMMPAARAPSAQAYWSIAEVWSGDAPCLALQDQSLAARLSPYLQGGDVSALVAGFRLQDQTPAAVAAFRALTVDLDKRIRKGKAHPIASDCADVACAAAALFGPDAGPRLLLLALAYHVQASDLGARADRAWTPAELDEALAAFDDLPADWFPLDARRFRVLLYRDAEARARIGPAPVGASDLIAIAGVGLPGVLVAGGWGRLDPLGRRATLVHELAHEYARTHHWRGEWSDAMGRDKALAKTEGRPLSSVSAYADESPDEDFAESVAAYRYMAQTLRERAPNRYAWLKQRVFGGLDYLDGGACQVRERIAVADR